MKPTENTLLPWKKKINLADREEWREYIFPGGEVVRINNPQFLIVSDNGHRIGGGEISHYIPYGWIRLSWMNKKGRGDNFYCENPDKLEREKDD